LALAEQLVDHLALLDWDSGANRYKSSPELDGRPTVVAWGEPGRPEGFRVLAQCASFLTRVLIRAYGPGTPHGWASGDHLRRTCFPALTGSGHTWSPRSRDYRRLFAEADGRGHFRAVPRVAELRPGDLVAIAYEMGHPGPHSGHVVMVRGGKGPLPGAPDGPGVAHVVEVVDCTHRPHGSPREDPAAFAAFPDTRWCGARGEWAGPHTGAGYGHMLFYADPATGAFTGYRWHPADPRLHLAAHRPAAAARVVP
jgi:hypothetical protein